MAEPRPLLIIGAGGHAGVLRDCVDPERFAVVGYIDDARPAGTVVAQEECVVGRLADLPRIVERHPGLVAVVGIGDNMTRRRVAESAERSVPGLEWAAIVHKSAIVSPSAEIGPGSVVFAGTILNCRARLGRHVLVNTGSIIEHDNRFADFSSTGPGVCTGGNVEVGELSHIGIGATVMHGIAIGANCVIGGQAFVDRDVGDDLVSFGVPARPKHQRALGAAYL